jgi:hypothetical protein
MAVAVDATTTDGTSLGSPQSSRTFSHTCSGSNRLLIVDVCNDEDGSAVTVSSVTYAGAALTERITVARGNVQRASIWYRVAPATGANDVVVTLASAQEFTTAARSYTGVNATTPLGTAASADANSTGPTVNVASATDELVHDVVSVNGAASYTIGAGQTQRWALTALDSSLVTVVDSRGSTEVGAATTTMSWTLALADDWVIAAVPIKPSAVAGSGTVTFTGGGDLTLGAGVAGPDHDFQVAINF